MDNIDKLAQKLAEMYKQNRNQPSTAPRLGEVVGTSPLKVRWGDSVIITEDKIHIPRLFSVGIMIPNRYQKTSGEMIEDEILWRIELKTGDRVIISTDEAMKEWFLIDLI